MKQFSIEITDEEFKVLEATILDIQAWAQHALKDKARKCIDRLIDEYSPVNPRLMSESDKLSFISKSTNIKSRAESEI